MHAFSSMCCSNPKSFPLWVPSLHTSVQADQTEGDAAKVKEYFEAKHWTKGKVIGTGAYCTCFLARDTKSGTIMAVKQVGGRGPAV